MFEEIATLDRSGTLQHEFLNARGAIARFERDAIEIRVLDVQETPVADLAIAELVTAAVRALAEERWVSLENLMQADTDELRAQLDRVVRQGDLALVDAPSVLAAFGVADPLPAGELWQRISDEVMSVGPHAGSMDLGEARQWILREGPLSRRLLRALGGDPSAGRTGEVYRELAACLAEGRMFDGGS